MGDDIGHNRHETNRVQEHSVVYRSDQQFIIDALRGPDEVRTALEHGGGRRRIAEACCNAGVYQEIALRVLMEESDLGTVRDYLTSPAAGMEGRSQAVRTADTWLLGGGDADIGFRVLADALRPVWRGYQRYPLESDMALFKDADSIGSVEEMADVWDWVLMIAEREKYVPATHILDVLGQWIDAGPTGGTGEIDSATVAGMRRIAKRAAVRLRNIFWDRPVALRHLYGLAIQIGVDCSRRQDWFSSLFPRWDNKWLYSDDDALFRIAEELARQPPAAVAKALALIVSEGIEDSAWGPIEMKPDGARRLAREIAARDKRPERMLVEMERHSADPVLLQCFLDRAADLRRPGWEVAIERLIGNGVAVDAAIRAALVYPAREELKRLAIRESAPWRTMVRDLVARGEVDQITIGLLFDAPCPAIAQAAALALAAAMIAERIDDLPLRLRARWREIIVGCSAARIDSWILAQIFERDNTICSDWVRAWFKRTKHTYESVDEAVLWSILSLDKDTRTALIWDVPRWSSATGSLRNVVLRLLDDNMTAAGALLDRPECQRLHGLILQVSIGPQWIERALMAMDHGLQPERIALMYQPAIRIDSRIADWQATLDAFASLLSTPDQSDAERGRSIVEAMIKRCEMMIDDARNSEKRRQGWQRRQ